MEGTLKKPRYALIDALRGFSLLNMIAYHLCFDIFQIYAVDTGWMFSNAAASSSSGTSAGLVWTFLPTILSPRPSMTMFSAE